MVKGEFICGRRWVAEEDGYIECELPLAHEGDHRKGDYTWMNFATKERSDYELEHAEKYGGFDVME